ncbi:nesprin-3 isoform X4 [Pseudoliparis swirei]|nr:nesprin-3 isoform X4 [Pseudoliparis swirei]
MTQQEFTQSLEAALSWMRAIQERLKASDNTQGPLEALEGRLRETEKIHQSEHEGRVKMDLALAAAELLLQSGDKELRTTTHSELRHLKGLWEETSTYIIHCHSRIEWVWLHWGEYLKAYEEFETWLTSRRRGLDAAVELQLGVKEKLWQADQQRVALSDIQGQAALLERLLDEAAALHNRTQDPGVEPRAQERLQEAYSDLRGRAQERLSLLQRVAEEHRTHRAAVHRFQSWLLSKTKELTDLLERKDTAESKLRALQVLDDSVAGEEKTLQHIEGVAEAVRGNTSPCGAEAVMEEAEELRLGWQRLRQGLWEAEEGLRCSLDSHSQYRARCQRLGEDIGRLRVLLQGLDQDLQEGLDQDLEEGLDQNLEEGLDQNLEEGLDQDLQEGLDQNLEEGLDQDLAEGLDQNLEEPRDARGRTDRTEEQMVGRWRKYSGVRNTLAGEESQVELLKAQLKELFRFSQDSRHLSDDVLAVVKEHQSVKCRATRLCSESESGLRNLLQDPLLVFAQWSHMTSQVLEASAEVTDSSHIAMLVQGIERLLKGSAPLQERLSLLQLKGDLLTSVFGAEASDCLQGELSAAARSRELLQAQLLQRKSRLQGLISRTKDFGDAHDLMRSKLAALRRHLVATDGLQPDILAKKSQSDRFRVVLKDLEDCEAPVTALETLASSSQSNRTQFQRLYAEWRELHQAARGKVQQSEESISHHESFHHRLLSTEEWLMVTKQTLQSFHRPPGGWSAEGRQLEAESALGEFPEKELQLQQLEVQSQAVLDRTSEEGRVHIQRDMKRLRESWLSLHTTSLHLHRLLDVSTGPSPGAGGPRSQGGRLRVASSGTSSGSGGAGGGLEGAVAHGEGLLSLVGRGDEHAGPPFGGDHMDSSAWRVLSSQREATGSTDIDAPPGGRASLASQPGDGEGLGRSSGGGVEAGGGLSPGGGAFMLFRRDRTKRPPTPTHHPAGFTGDHQTRRRDFEAWLSKENSLLSGVSRSKGAALSAKEVQTRQDTLKALRAGLGWGQDQFQLLLQESPGGEDVGLEEVRYRWMLYKSKLKDVGDLRARAKRLHAKQEESASAAKVQKLLWWSSWQEPGLCQRVCRLALPLWLLLLALLLLAFLLPFMDGSSCSLSNNYARSFSVMLRYEAPPPT